MLLFSYILLRGLTFLWVGVFTKRHSVSHSTLLLAPKVSTDKHWNSVQTGAQTARYINLDHTSSLWAVYFHTLWQNTVVHLSSWHLHFGNSPDADFYTISHADLYSSFRYVFYQGSTKPMKLWCQIHPPSLEFISKLNTTENVSCILQIRDP